MFKLLKLKNKKKLSKKKANKKNKNKEDLKSLLFLFYMPFFMHILLYAWRVYGKISNI